MEENENNDTTTNGRSSRKKRKYDKSVHMDWVDKRNYGISHFGIHPDQLDRGTIRMDTFHLKCAITRALMTYNRQYLESYMSLETRQQFYKELEKFWNSYHKYV